MHDDISLSGVSTAARATLGQTVQDLKGPKTRALGPSVGDGLQTLGSAMPNRILGPTAPQGRTETSLRPAETSPGDQSLHPVATSLGPTMPVDKQSKTRGLAVSQLQGVESYGPAVHQSTYGAALATEGLRNQKPVGKDVSKNLGPDSASAQQSQQAQIYGHGSDGSDGLEVRYREALASGAHRAQSLGPQLHVGQENIHHGPVTAQTQREKAYQLSLSQSQGARRFRFSVPQEQGTNTYFSAVTNRQGVREDTNGLRTSGSPSAVGKEDHSYGSATLHVQNVESYGPMSPDVDSVSALGQESQRHAADHQDAKHLSRVNPEVKMPKALDIPMQTGRNTQPANTGKY